MLVSPIFSSSSSCSLFQSTSRDFFLPLCRFFLTIFFLIKKLEMDAPYWRLCMGRQCAVCPLAAARRRISRNAPDLSTQYNYGWSSCPLDCTVPVTHIYIPCWAVVYRHKRLPRKVACADFAESMFGFWTSDSRLFHFQHVNYVPLPEAREMRSWYWRVSTVSNRYAPSNVHDPFGSKKQNTRKKRPLHD